MSLTLCSFSRISLFLFCTFRRLWILRSEKNAYITGPQVPALYKLISKLERSGCEAAARDVSVIKEERRTREESQW